MSMSSPKLRHFYGGLPHISLPSMGSQASQGREKQSLCTGDIRLRHYTHSPAVFHRVLRRLVDQNLFVHVDRVVELIRTQNCPCSEDIALTVIKAYAKRSMPDKAVDVFQRMVEIFGCKPGIRSYNTLLNALIESNQWSKAEAFFAYLETIVVSPNLRTYNILIEISCMKSRFEIARRLLDWMWEKNLTPDVFSYGTSINAHEKSGILFNALNLLDEMSHRGVVPDVTFYNILIDRFLKNRDYGKASEIIVEFFVFPPVIFMHFLDGFFAIVYLFPKEGISF